MKGRKENPTRRRVVLIPSRKPTSPKPQAIDSWGQRLSHWSQFAMLILVAFGYVFTVRPVYQKERLEEEVAGLKAASAEAVRDAEAASERVASLNMSLEALSDRERELRASETKLTTEREALKAQIIALSHESEQLTSTVDDLSRTAHRQRESIREAHSAMLTDRLNAAFGGRMLQISDASQSFFDTEDSALDEWVASPDIAPHSIALEIVDQEIESGELFGLPKPSDVSLELVGDFRQRLMAAKDKFACPKIDKPAWRNSWISARASYRETVPQCVDMHVNRIRSKEGWSGQQLSSWLAGGQGRGYAESARHACTVSAEFRTATTFSEARFKIESACLHALSSAVAIVSGEKAVEKIESLNPPQVDKTWYLGWYQDDSGNPKDESSKQ